MIPSKRRERRRARHMGVVVVIMVHGALAAAQPGPEGESSDEKAATDVEDDAERRALLEAADSEIGAPTAPPKPKADQVFLSGTRSLQAFNPEISVVADALIDAYLNEDGYVAGDDGVERSGFSFRTFELSLQSNLDPYSFAKFIFAVEDGEAGLEEGYIRWVGLVPRTSIILGRFRQQLGVVNRWHQHALDQFDRPLVHGKYLGEEGLGGTGVSAKILLPRLWAHALELSLEVTNGENEALYSGQLFSVPSGLAHVKNYWDLGPSTYVELGLSGLWGLNNQRGVIDEMSGAVSDEPRRQTVLGAADLTVSWVPIGRARYRGITSRSEVLYLRKQVDEMGERETGDALGGYTYLDARIGPRAIVGARFDIGQNFAIADHTWFWQASPYLTFWQSEFVFLRLQYGATKESDADLAHRVTLQLDWSAGPHKHEKY